MMQSNFLISKAHSWLTDKNNFHDLDQVEPTDFMKTGEITNNTFLFAYNPNFKFETDIKDLSNITDNELLDIRDSIRHVVANEAISNILANRISDIASESNIFIDLCINRYIENDRIQYLDSPLYLTYHFRFPRLDN